MRKDLKLPRTVEEMETRIKNASFQLRIAPRTVDRENLRQRIGYVFDEREIYPPEIREEIRRDLDRRRRKLSDRVRRQRICQRRRSRVSRTRT